MLRKLSIGALLLGLCLGLSVLPARADDPKGDKMEKKTEKKTDKKADKDAESKTAPPWAREGARHHRPHRYDSWHHRHHPGHHHPRWPGKFSKREGYRFEHHWGGWDRRDMRPHRARGPGLPHRRPHVRLPSPDELFQRFDADQNGSLSKEEFAQGLKTMRERFHKKFSERTRHGARSGHFRPHHGPAFRDQRGPMGRPGWKPPSAVDLFNRFDENKDGKLVKEEVPPPLWARLSKADANNDGSVTKEELEAARKTMRERFQEGMQKRAAAGKEGSRDRPKHE